MLDPSTFAYDQQMPLTVEILSERVQNGAIVRDITYASPRGGKVTAYLILPFAWYNNCGHALDAQVRLERVTWLCAQFGLPEPSQEILNLLEQVPSPVPLES
ncbi:MAG TPA: hypothetical protein VEI53_04120 [Ktedonobacteraceae bacterium]|nr:hypothetical protein [Ktedonobacteraceae bacterium]